MADPFSGYRRPGLDWQVGDFYAAAFADSARGHYIVSTNSVEARDSYNEDNVHDPDHPMRQHGNGAAHPTHFELNGTGMRFWTFMSLIEQNYGRIDVDEVQQWRTTHFVLDRNGTRHDHLELDGRQIPIYLAPGAATLCRHTFGPPGVDSLEGINIYVSLSVPQDRTSFRTKGRPCEWVGPWDRLSLRRIPPEVNG